MSTGVRVVVPATSANLGPGFDALGLGLGLHDVVEARATSGGLEVTVRGEGADRLPRSARHLVVRAMRATFAELGGEPGGLSVSCTNRIPQGRGLGSSAAAVVAGVLAARALVPAGPERLGAEAALALAARLEGHPDNVAPCLLGGLTVAWSTPDAGVRATRVDVHPGIRPVVCVPDAVLSTKAARGMLPATVPHVDAARTAGRAALLMEALTRRPDLLFDATEDLLHQPYREEAMPATLDLVRGLRSKGLAAVVSGAGPSVLVLARDDEVATVEVPDGWDVRPLEVADRGARISALPDRDADRPAG